METLESRSCFGIFGPSLARWSARSFPLTLTWPGTQWMCVVTFAFLSLWMLLCARRMYSWPGIGMELAILLTADWLSQNIQTSVVGWSKSCVARWVALEIP